MSDEPIPTLGDIEALLRENEEEAIKRIKARMACCALGLIAMSTEEVACCRALLNKHEPDKKAIEHGGRGGGPIIVRIAAEDEKV